MNDCGDDALFAVIHSLAKAGSKGVHFVARIARFDEAEDGFADLDIMADEGNKFDAGGFNLGTGLARIQVGNSKGGGMLLEHFAFDQCDLPFGRQALPILATKVTFVLLDSLARNEIKFVGLKERFPSDRRVNV